MILTIYRRKHVMHDSNALFRSQYIPLGAVVWFRSWQIIMNFQEAMFLKNKRLNSTRKIYNTYPFFSFVICVCARALKFWGIIPLFHLQTDRAAMLDEILDYVKFLRLQVKVRVCIISMTYMLTLQMYWFI